MKEPRIMETPTHRTPCEQDGTEWAVILWDVDGVLVTGPSFADVLATRHGIGPDVTHAFFAGPFRQCLIGEADLVRELPPFLHQWGWRDSLEAFLAEWFTSEMTLNPVVVSAMTVAYRRGIPQYLATNQERHRAAYLLAHLPVARYLAGAFPSWELSCLKDDPRFWQRTLVALGRPEPRRVLFWDDSPTNVSRAREAGLDARLYQTPAAFVEAMAPWGLASAKA